MSEKKFPDCWVFEQNRRIYAKPKPGDLWPSGGPIWREHWVKVEIVGETSRSWLTKCRRKVPKKGGPGVSFSQEEIDQQEWVHDHKYKIYRAVERINDYEILKQVAELVGYKG